MENQSQEKITQIRKKRIGKIVFDLQNTIRSKSLERPCENAGFRLSKFDAFHFAAMVKRRLTHKYVDRYYSRLAMLRKRNENFRGTDTSMILTRLRPSEAAKRKVLLASGAEFLYLYDVTRARSLEDDKRDEEAASNELSRNLENPILELTQFLIVSNQDL